MVKALRLISCDWKKKRSSLLVAIVKQIMSLYLQLMDLALEYIVGGKDDNSGLKLLEEIVLPKKSFVTENGLQVC